MCLAHIKKTYEPNQMVAYGWKIFRVTRKKTIYSCFHGKKTPHTIGKTYKARSIAIKSHHYNLYYKSGFHYYPSKQDAQEVLNHIFQTYSKKEYKIFPVQIQNIMYEGKEWFYNGTTYHIDVNVGEKMTILGVLDENKSKSVHYSERGILPQSKTLSKPEKNANLVCAKN